MSTPLIVLQSSKFYGTLSGGFGGAVCSGCAINSFVGAGSIGGIRLAGGIRLRVSRPDIHIATIGSDLLLDLIGLNRNERLTISLGKRIWLRILRTHDFGIGHCLARGDFFQFTVLGNGMVFGDHGRVIGDIWGDLIRQGSVRIIRHCISGSVILNGLSFQLRRRASRSVCLVGTIQIGVGQRVRRRYIQRTKHGNRCDYRQGTFHAHAHIRLYHQALVFLSLYSGYSQSQSLIFPVIPSICTTQSTIQFHLDWRIPAIEIVRYIQQSDFVRNI